jgi:hypothetical protein
MALTHATDVRNAGADAKLNLIDQGSGNPNGQLVYMDSGDADVATAELSIPAFGAAANGVKTAGAIADTGNGTGTVALFKFVDRDGVEKFRGTVTGIGGGGDIELTSVALSNEPIRTTSFTYTEGA